MIYYLKKYLLFIKENLNKYKKKIKYFLLIIELYQL